MPKPIYGASVQTFQYLDGTNSTSAGVDAKFKLGDRASLSTFTGVVTDFAGSNSFRVDLKPSFKYNNILSFGSRIRTQFSDKSASTQFRITPVKITIPVDKKSDVYLDPHYYGKIDYTTQQWSNSAGALAGYEMNFNKHISGFAEIQGYNFQDFHPKRDISFNAGISYKF